MQNVSITLKFGEPGYIGLPYWPELNTLINISKDVHPKLGDQKKQQAILAACEKRGITPEQYEDLKTRSARPFYSNGTGEIVIPERVFQSFLNHASMLAPKAVPSIKSKGLTFIGIRVLGGHLHTGKNAADGTFDRFVKNEESNQRMWCSTAFIANFMLEGGLQVDPEVIKPDDLRKLVEWGGKWVGIGGARPQGYGRFQVIEWGE